MTLHIWTMLERGRVCVGGGGTIYMCLATWTGAKSGQMKYTTSPINSMGHHYIKFSSGHSWGTFHKTISDIKNLKLLYNA